MTFRLDPYNGCRFPIDPDGSEKDVWGYIIFKQTEYSEKTGSVDFEFGLEVGKSDLSADLLDKENRRRTLNLVADEDYEFVATQLKSRDSSLEVYVNKEGPYLFASKLHAAGKIEKKLSITAGYIKSGSAVVAQLAIGFGPVQRVLEIKKKKKAK